MDADWKLVVFLHNVLSSWSSEEEKVVFTLSQEVISCCLGANKSIEMLTFAFRYVGYLFEHSQNKSKLVIVHDIVKSGL